MVKVKDRNAFKRGAMSFDDFNYQYFNDSILIPTQKKKDQIIRDYNRDGKVLNKDNLRQLNKATVDTSTEERLKGVYFKPVPE